MNYLEILVVYGIGTIVGIWLTKRYVQEVIITRTIDTLVEEDYVRSYLGDDGEIHLYKWYDLEDVIEAIAKEREEENEDDDA